MTTEIRRVTTNPAAGGGRPCIRGMRIRATDIWLRESLSGTCSMGRSGVRRPSTRPGLLAGGESLVEIGEPQ
ncbi:MAG: DUF433 domain-containing protein [Myxococcales bacterium]|nr:DUF433 domain-containing protein [Myxococcales bacterium]